MIDINDGINIENTAQYIGANTPHIINQHQIKLNQLPYTLQSEVNTTVNNIGGTYGLSRVEILNREQTAVNHLINIKVSERNIHQAKATSFYGADPLARSHQDLVEAYLRNPSPGAPQRWADCYTAAYAVQLATEEIRQLSARANALNSQIAQAQAQIAAAQEQARIAAQQVAQRQAQIALAREQARVAAQQQAQRQAQIAQTQEQARIAAQQEAQRQAQVAQAQQEQARIAAQQEAQRQVQIAQAQPEQARIAARKKAQAAQAQTQVRRREQQAQARAAARRAVLRRKQRFASATSAQFNALLQQFALNQPEDVDQKLRLMKDRYKKLYAAHVKASKAARKVEGLLAYPKITKRQNLLKTLEKEVETLTRSKNMGSTR